MAAIIGVTIYMKKRSGEFDSMVIALGPAGWMLYLFLQVNLVKKMAESKSYNMQCVMHVCDYMHVVKYVLTSCDVYSWHHVTSEAQS